MGKKQVYAVFNTEIYKIHEMDDDWTGFQATSYDELCDICSVHGWELAWIEGLDD